MHPYFQFVLQITLDQIVPNVERNVKPVTLSQENVPNCQNSYFGENCQNNCPTNCLDLICDQGIGTCKSCTKGFEGRHCEHQIAAYISPRSLY